MPVSSTPVQPRVAEHEADAAELGDLFPSGVGGALWMSCDKKPGTAWKLYRLAGPAEHALFVDYAVGSEAGGGDTPVGGCGAGGDTGVGD